MLSSLVSLSSAVFLEVFYLLHDFAEDFGAILRRIAVFDQADFYIEFELIPYDLIVEPIGERGFGVNNLFDLFNTKFGQPGAPSYSRFNVTNQGIEVVTYKTDAAGNKTVYNTIHVKRDTPHSVPLGYENVQVEQPVRNGEKFIRNGQLYIMKDGVTYNILGISVK